MESSALVPPAPDPNDLFDDIFYDFSPVSINHYARSVAQFSSLLLPLASWPFVICSTRELLFDTREPKPVEHIPADYFDGSLLNSESAGEDVLEESARSPSFITYDELAG